MNAFGLHVTIRARSGRGEELADLLLEGAEALEANDACVLYAVHRDPEQPDAVHVTEVWTDAAAHAASLQEPETREAIERARPLIAEIAGHQRLDTLGGKGLSDPPGLA
jgi:quinol monooxygenase YgiN